VRSESAVGLANMMLRSETVLALYSVPILPARTLALSFHRRSQVSRHGPQQGVHHHLDQFELRAHKRLVPFVRGRRQDQPGNAGMDAGIRTLWGEPARSCAFVTESRPESCSCLV
jgi:hypothetical protein